MTKAFIIEKGMLPKEISMVLPMAIEYGTQSRAPNNTKLNAENILRLIQKLRIHLKSYFIAFMR